MSDVSCTNPSNMALLTLHSWLKIYTESPPQYIREPLGTVCRIRSVDLGLFPLHKGKNMLSRDKTAIDTLSN